MKRLRAVSRFEAGLLRVLPALLHRAPPGPALTLLETPTSRPACLSRDAVELIEDTLARGCVHFLARHGWPRARHLRGPAPVVGRLWERTPPAELGLRFSQHSLEFLIQLQCGSFANRVPSAADLTVADRLLLVLAFDVLRGHAPGHALATQWTAINQDGLARLAFLKELAGSRQGIDWLPWTTGLGACILESLQTWLAERWAAVERKKESIQCVQTMRMLGANQRRVLGEYLDALETANRRDLARCLLDSAQRLLRGQPSARWWVRGLDLGDVRLADRSVIHADALAFLSQLERLQAWQEQARGVAYFDEEYQVSQFWKADWERHDGDRIVEQARALLHELAPMK